MSKLKTRLTKTFKMATSLLVKTSHQVFQDCKAHFNEQVRPFYNARAIQNYTKKKKVSRLVKGWEKMNDFDVFVGEV